MRLFSIFTKKKWIEIDGHDETLKRFGELIETLDENQINLMLELAEQYTWFSYNDYQSTLRKLLIEIYNSKLEKIDNVIIFPIIKPEEESKTKSGHAVMYMMTGVKTSISNYEKINIKTLESFEDIKPENLILNEKDYLILVDDYVGSGNTLDKTLLEIEKNDSIKNRFSVLSVIMQDDAIDKLTKRNIHFIYGKNMKKGISDFFSEPLLTQKKGIMENIEKRIPKVKKYRFGYEESEALVTLIKTPNNTFPIFWKEYLHKGKLRRAPFSRY